MVQYMSSALETEFWISNHKYKDLVREYEQHIHRYSPESVTSRGMCPCLDYCNWCGWAGTKVVYQEYNGPKLW